MDQEKNAQFLPLLKALTDRIGDCDTNSVDLDEEDNEKRPTKLILNVDELTELASTADEAVKQAVMTLMKSPAVAKKRRRVDQVRPDQPVPLIPALNTRSRPPTDQPPQGNLTDAYSGHGYRAVSQPGAPAAGHSITPQGAQGVTPGLGQQYSLPPPPGGLYQYPAHQAMSSISGLQPQSLTSVGFNYQAPQTPYSSAQPPGGPSYAAPYSNPYGQPQYSSQQLYQSNYYHSSPEASWNVNLLSLAHEKKHQDPYTRAVPAVPSTTLIVGDSKTEFQLLLPRHFTEEGLISGPKPKNERPRDVREYALASYRISTAMRLEAYPEAFRDYINYVMYMIGLSTNHNWDSIMRLDEEFRRAQVFTGQRWGPPPHSMTVLTLTASASALEREESLEETSQDERKKSPCLNWNRGPCSYGACIAQSIRKVTKQHSVPKWFVFDVVCSGYLALLGFILCQPWCCRSALVLVN